jgi:hypothetical protein
MTYELKNADNGWIASWWDEDTKHYRVFEVSDDIDLMREDPQALVDLLYFVKEEIAGQMGSKHKKTNVWVRLETNEDEAA